MKFQWALVFAFACFMATASDDVGPKSEKIDCASIPAALSSKVLGAKAQIIKQELVFDPIEGDASRVEETVDSLIALVKGNEGDVEGASASAVSDALARNIYQIYTADVVLDDPSHKNFQRAAEWIGQNGSPSDVATLAEVYKSVPRIRDSELDSSLQPFVSTVEGAILNLGYRHGLRPNPFGSAAQKATHEFRTRYGKDKEDFFEGFDPINIPNTISYRKAPSFQAQVAGLFHSERFDKQELLLDKKLLTLDPLESDEKNWQIRVLANLSVMRHGAVLSTPIDIDSKLPPALFYIDALRQMSRPELMVFSKGANKKSFVNSFSAPNASPLDELKLRKFEQGYSYPLEIVSTWDAILSEIFSRQGELWMPNAEKMLEVAKGSDPFIFETLIKTTTNPKVYDFSKQFLEQ